MKASELKHFRQLLEIERDTLIDSLHDHDRESRELLEPKSGDTIDVSENPTGKIPREISQHETNLMRKIELAIQRIDDGTYGICTHCKSVIPVSRLNAKPSVSLCHHCQDEKEHLA